MVWLLLPLLVATAAATSSQQPPTITECTPGLLQLTPCSPYVQGLSASPLEACCDDLTQLYLHQPACLCLIITTPNLGSFPINTTLAMYLPSLCGIHVKDPSTACFPGASSPASPLRAHSNSSLGLVGRKPNSTAPSTVVAQIKPMPVIMGIGQSCSFRLGREVLLMLLVWCLFLLTLKQ